MEKQHTCLTENITSFPLQIESYYKLILRNTGPKRMCPFLQAGRTLVEQLMGRVSGCQSFLPVTNLFSKG